MHAYRTHTCGDLRAADAAQNVRLSGWIHRKRDHGGLMFVDLRDHYGLTQIVLSPETPGFDLVERLRAESVIRIDGDVVARTPETVNPNLPTGEIEVRARTVELLSEAAAGASDDGGFAGEVEERIVDGCIGECARSWNRSRGRSHGECLEVRFGSRMGIQSSRLAAKTLSLRRIKTEGLDCRQCC